jgi:NADH-quinone oxidoreductase subunit H
VVIISQALAVAFFTLLERKTLGLRQRRVGPTKAGWGGVGQPPLDGVKLIFKEESGPGGGATTILLVALGLFLLALVG